MNELFSDLFEESTVFTQENAILGSSYIPSELPHREKELITLSECIKQFIKSGVPANTLIVGKSGTGKTLLLKHMAYALREIPGLQTVVINCRTRNTPTAVYGTILNQSFHPGISLPELYRRVVHTIESKHTKLLLLLDETLRLSSQSGSSTLENLLWMNEDLETSRISLIITTATVTWIDELDPELSSLLRHEEIILHPYSADQLYDILKHRERAFRPGVIDDCVLLLCAARGAHGGGSATQAIGLLRKTGETAERRGIEKITVQHVFESEQELDHRRRVECAKNLSVHPKLLLIGILNRWMNDSRTRHAPLTTGEAFRSYEETCYLSGVCEPLTQRRISDLLTGLEEDRLLQTSLVFKGRYGTTREIRLDEHIQPIIAALKQDPFYNNLLEIDHGEPQHG